MGLRQKDAAEHIGVTTDSITNWELSRTKPAIRHMPAIIEFLGYLPFPPGKSFPERLKAYRTVKGLSQKSLTEELGVDPSTMRKWEAGTSQPSRSLRKYVSAIIEPALRQLEIAEHTLRAR